MTDTGPSAELSDSADSGGPARRVRGWARGASRLWSDRLPSGSALAANLVPPLVYLAVSVSIAWPVVRHLGQRVPGGADGVLFSWYFEWIAQSISHGHNPFVSGALNAPDGVNVMWNTAVFLLAVICIPLTLSIGAFATVALAMVLSPAISAAVAYWVLRRLSGRVLGSAIGAAVYGYGPFMRGQVGHLHLLFAPFPPLLMLLGHRLLISQKGSPVRLGVLLGVTVAVQILVSEELLALCAIAGLVALVWLVALNPAQVRPRARYALTGGAVALATTVPIVAVPLVYQFFGSDSLKTFLFEKSPADLASFVRPTALQYYRSPADLRADLHYPANGTVYLGWPLIIAAVAVCAWFAVRRQRFAIWWLLTALSLAVLMLGTPTELNGHPIIHGPWALIRKLPLLHGAIPSRISLLMLLSIGGLIAWALAQVRGRAYVAAALAAVAVLIPLRPVLPIAGSQLPPMPRFFTTSAVNAIPRGAVTVVLPQAGFPRNDAMVWQIRTHLRFALVGGYSVFKVGGHATYVPQLPGFVNALRRVGQTGHAPQTLPAWRPSATRSPIRFIVITDHQPYMQAVIAAAARITGCAPHPVADVVLCQIPAAPTSTPPHVKPDSPKRTAGGAHQPTE